MAYVIKSPRNAIGPQRRLERLKTFLLVARISFTMWWVSILVGVCIFDLTEESNWVVILILSFLLFFIATIGSLVIFLKGR